MTEKNKTMLEKIYDKYDKLIIESKNDTILDKTDLDRTGFNVTMNITKWINKKIEWNMALRNFEDKRKKQYRALYEFYDTESPRKLTTKSEYDLFIESDPGYSECYNNAIVCKEIVAYCDSIIDNLKNKQWETKQYIEWVKFKNGQ